VPTNDRTFPSFDGNSAEWIMERPTVHDTWGSHVPPLPNYDVASVSVALSQRQNLDLSYYLSEQNEQFSMVGYRLLSNVAPVDFESMLFEWVGFQ
jgi:hypothetical protein